MAINYGYPCPQNQQNMTPEGADPNGPYPIYPTMRDDEVRLTARLERIERKLDALLAAVSAAK